MKTCFSEGKLMKQFGNTLFLRGPPFQLTTLFQSMTALFVQISKQEPPPPPPPDFKEEGKETMHIIHTKVLHKF